VTVGPRFRVKARTGEAFAAVNLLRFVPQLTLRQLDDCQQNLSTFRNDTLAAPIESQLFSRIAIFASFCAPLTAAQQKVWDRDANAYRERVSQLRTLGSALLLEWQGAEAAVFPDVPQPQGWDVMKTTVQELLDRLEGNKVDRSKHLKSPRECSSFVRRALAKQFKTLYDQEEARFADPKAKLLGN
jgi:hypothetical protein